jgi:tryptophanyl-tRNA synthetase
MLQKVHVTKMSSSDPFAQVELDSDDSLKIKIANIDLDGNLITRASKKEIEIHAVIY